MLLSANLRWPGVFCGAFMVSIAASWPAASHQAASGWNYPNECCSMKDCRAVSADKVSESPTGYVIRSTGEEIAYTDRRIRNSPDGEHHWCSVGGRDDSRTICLFVPPVSF